MQILLVIIIAVCTILIAYIKWIFSHWQRHGFPYVEAKIPFGILDAVWKRERSVGMAIFDVYQNATEKVVGIYLMFRPALLVRDAQLARDILTKDFASFHDRGVYVDELNDPMSASLFALEGQKWKALRTKLAPLFTSGKLKAMFGTTLDIGDKMLDHLNKQIADEGCTEIELKGVISTYAIDIIGSVIFGLDVNSFQEPNNPFHKLSADVNTPTLGGVLRGTAQFIYPNLEKIFVRLGWIEAAVKTMKEIVKQTVEFREKNNISRKDMTQLLLQLRNAGKVNDDNDTWAATKSVADSNKSMSVETIAAQLFLFYVAGYETSASAAAFTIYELAQYPELLAKAQADVERVIKTHNGELTYEALQDMKFIDLCIMETIRKYPALPILNRQCTEDYHMPDSDLVIKAGTPIIISLFGIHRDAEYFPHPMVYNPERFLEHNMAYDPVAYMPFGEGPRHCIAQRMGKINVKVALAKIFMNFNIEINEKRKEIEIDNYGIPILPKGGINVRLSKKRKT